MPLRFGARILLPGLACLMGTVRGGLLWQSQAVANPALRVDQRRAERVKLAPQVADVGLDDLRLARVIPSPDVLEQLCPGQNSALVPHQVREQPELRG